MSRKGMNCTCVTALAVASGLCLAAPAGAATVPTSIEIDGYGYGAGRQHVEGRVKSPRLACTANRRVRMSSAAGGAFGLFATDVSSDNGFWGGEGPLAGPTPTEFKARVLPRRLGPNRRCAGAVDFQTVPTGKGRLQRTLFPTNLEIDAAAIGDAVFAEGQVFARKACRRNRRVRIVALRDEGDLLVDADRASDNGYWGGGGPAVSSEGVRAVAPRKRLGSGDRCAAASDEVVP